MSDRFQPPTFQVPASDALIEFMRDGWADGDDPVEADVDRAVGAQARREALEPALRRRADRDTGRRTQAARERHRLPVPGRHRPRLPHRQPVVGCRAGDRRRRRDALLPATARQERRRLLARRPLRRGVGRATSLARRGRGDSSGSSAGTSTSCPRCWRRAVRPGCTAASIADVDALLADKADPGADDELAVFLSEMRLVKDEWEVEQLQDAVDATMLGLRGLGAGVGQGRSSTASAGSRARSSVGRERPATTSATSRSSLVDRTPPPCTGSTTPARSHRAS